MPLRIPIPNKYGLDCDYWVIVEINVNIQRQQAHVVIEGWRSKAAFTAKFSCLDQRVFDWSGADHPFADGSGNLLRAAYDKIKTLAPFTQAAEE